MNNKITINLGDNYYEQDVPVQIGPPVLNKELTAADENKAILTWNSVIKAPENGLKNTIFRDVLGTGLTLLEETVKINGIPIGQTDYIFTKTDYGFEIDFGNINPGEIFDISYDTSFDDSQSGTFENEAFVIADGITVTDKATYEYNKKDNYITKYVDNKGSEDAYKTGIVSWQIDIDEMPAGTNTANITDIIPDGMEYVEGSAKLVLNKNPYTTYTLTPIQNGKTLTFDITDHIDEIDGENGVSIFYESRVTDAFENKTYVNKAYITIDGKEYPEVSASISGKVTNLIDKEAVYNRLTAPEVLYTIKVNEGSLDLDKNSDTIVLDDRMGEALAFIMGSLEVNGEKWNDYEWNPDTRVLAITVPDSTALTITYTARVNLAVGEELTSENAYNYVKIYGYDDDATEDGYEIIGDVLDSSATSSGDTKTIYVYKYKDEVMTTPMEGAEFQLIECGYEGSGDTFRLTGEETVVDTLVTGSNGYASYSGLAYDHVYKLVETKTNDGYILDDEERYFVYPGTDGTDYPDYISEKRDTWTFYINNNYSKTDINVSKKWNDEDFKDRPGYVKVYLKQNGNYVLDGSDKVFKILSASNNWQASFDNLDKYDDNGNLYNYTIEEEVPTNYEAKYEYTEGTNKKDVIITNTLTNGSLTINKTVSGNAGEQDRDFTFKIELFDENNPLTGSYNYTGSKTGTITSGDTVTLKHSESITINELPVGTVYKVTEVEANTDGYETAVTDGEGTIDFGTQTAKFVNIKNETPKGSLTVSKTVSGTAGEQDRDFTFKIELFDKDNNPLTESYNYTGSKTGTITSGDTVTLKHSESITINELPVNTIYKVTEVEANTDGYETSVTDGEGTITEGGASAVFVNTKNETPKGSLTVSKIVGGNAGEQNRDFTFKIELFDENNNSLTGSYNYTGSKTGTITSGETVTLKHSESITINDLPVNTTYKVTEVEANTDGYVTNMTNDTGTITEGNITAMFENIKTEIPVLKGFLTINKTVTGAGDKNQEFTFKIDFTDASGNIINENFVYSGSKTGTITSGETVTLKHGESITIVDLPVGTRYKVTEIEANADGYKTTAQNTENVIDIDGEIVSFVNHKDAPKSNKEESKIVKDNKTLYIPQTGVSNNIPLYGVGALMSALSLIVLYRRK